MAYLSVLRQKERRLVGFSTISSFQRPAKEKEIFLTGMCFFNLEKTTPVFDFIFVVSQRE